MALPVILQPHTSANAEDVMAIAYYLESLAGGGGSSGVTPNRRIFGWNVQEQEDTNSPIGRRLVRIEPDKNATATQVGTDGFRVMTTSATSGDADSQLHTVFAIQALPGSPNKDFVYIKPDWRIQHVDGEATKIDDYRLTYTRFSEPKVVFEYKTWSKASVITYKASDFGVPTHAKMIEVAVRLYGPGSGDAFVQIGQARATRNRKYGLFLEAYANRYSAGKGEIPLGEGSYAGQFVFDTSAALGGSSLYVVGWWG